MQLYTSGMIRNRYQGVPALDYFNPVNNEYRVENTDVTNLTRESFEPGSVIIPEVVAEISAIQTSTTPLRLYACRGRTDSETNFFSDVCAFTWGSMWYILFFD